MTVKKFARIAPRIAEALYAASQTIASLKATVPTTPLRETWTLAAEGDSWIIYSVFGRRILFRAEAAWLDDDPRSRIVAYLEEYLEDRAAHVWTPLDVVVENGEVPLGEEGENISAEWHLLESVLTALSSRSMIFCEPVPNRTR